MARRLLLRALPLVLLAALAAGLSALSGMPYWGALLVLLLAVVTNSVLMNLEDDLPGGWNNPDGTATPRYVPRLFWTIRILTALLVLFIAVQLVRNL